jgi:hypothetical protein
VPLRVLSGRLSQRRDASAPQVPAAPWAVRLGREFDALRVAFLWVLSFGEAKVKYLDGGARPAKWLLLLVYAVENRASIRYADDVLHAASARRTGRRACVAKPSFTSRPPHKHGLRLPDRPRPGEAHLNSRFANVKSLKHRRLRPRPGHPSACLTGPRARRCGGNDGKVKPGLIRPGCGFGLFKMARRKPDAGLTRQRDDADVLPKVLSGCMFEHRD